MRLRVVLVFLLLAATSCGSPAALSPSEVVGSWVCSGPGTKSGELTIDADGTFTGHNLPGHVFYSVFSNQRADTADWSSLDSIRGTWRLDWNEQSKQTAVVLDIHERFQGAQLIPGERNGAMELTYFIADPDGDQYLAFHRNTN
ncbi:hypothetical protein [Arthrobacter sp. 9MFCol3.1]|uniref:hypothetical protein n=1 Tax=Arthrobacter sp. 9MFCol3.1 TaxID=1150398 RepID=UPI0012DD7E7B|nr:hypothetical protein [Arthrobacter sp. 9MFCol3.1]